MSDSTGTFSDEDRPRLSLTDYVDAVRRHLWLLLLPSLALAIAGCVVVRAMPSVYASTATILVESQQIPEDLVRTTVTSFIEERIEVIRQKVLTRANVLDIIDRYQLYPESRVSRSELVERFTRNLEIQRVTAERGFQQLTIAFNLSFFDEQPVMAQRVASELATLFLNENVATRSERAAETTRFLQEEAEGLQEQIRKVESRVSEFKQRNRDRLPEMTQVNMGRLERMQREYQQSAVALAGLEQEYRYLRSQVEGRSPASADEPLSTAPLAELRARLDRMLLAMTESHPDVQQVRKMIEIREAELRSMGLSPGAVGEGGQEDRGSLDLDAPIPPSTNPVLVRDLESVRERILYTRTSRSDMAREIAELEDRVNMAPAVEKEWSDLQRGLDNLTAKYEELRNKELEARMAQSLEEEQKGERFVLLEPPLVPTEAARPQRSKLYAMVLAASGGLGGGLVILAELLQPGLRGDTVIAYHLGTMPLAAIPYIVTPAELLTRRRRRRMVMIGATVLVGLGLLSVHLLVMPVDELFLRFIPWAREA